VSDVKPAETKAARDDPLSDFPVVDRGAAARRARLATLRIDSLAAGLCSTGPRIATTDLSPALATALRDVEARHRAILSQPLEHWTFDALRRDYANLGGTATGDADREAIASRLAHIDRQATFAQTARELAAAVERARHIDADVAAIRARVFELTAQQDGSFETQGLLQTSSTLVDGRQAYILIDARGRTSAYIVVPPGLDVRPYLARRVGVRGDSRFHATLKSRIVTARQIEPLDNVP
jgi:hypothetical protein